MTEILDGHILEHLGGDNVPPKQRNDVVRRSAGWTRLENDTVIHCAMRECAKFRGEWDDRRSDWRWQKLGNAARQQGIEVIGAHQALADCRTTLAVVRTMAKGAES